MKSRLSIVRGRVSASARALGALCGVSILAACGGGPDDPSASAAAERKRPLAESRVAPPAAVTDLFRWAERTYPHYFPAGPVDQSAAPYVYRYYASTLNYLGVDGQDVYVLGPVSSGELLRVGSLSDFACPVSATGCSPEVMPGRIASSGNFTIALMPDRSVRAWGSSDLIGSTQFDDFVHVQVPDLPPARAVYTNGTYPYGLVLTTGGELYGWGYEPSHAFGVPIADNIEIVRRPIRLPGLDRVVDVSMCTEPGGPSIYALREDGSVWIAPGQEENRTMRPRPLAGISGVKSLGSFDDAYVTRQVECKVHAIRGDGSVWMLRGSVSAVNRLKVYDATATRVTGLPAVKQVACNYDHCLALAQDGAVWAWGENRQGQLGDGTQTDRSAPVRVRNVTGIRKVAVSNESSYALTVSGSVIHWGSWPLQQPASTSNGAPIRLLNDSFDIVDIYSVRFRGLFAIRRDGEVLAWGNNFGGKLAPGPSDVRTPSRIPDLRL